MGSSLQRLRHLLTPGAGSELICVFIHVACLAHLLSAVGLVDSMLLAQFAGYQFTYVWSSF